MKAVSSKKRSKKSVEPQKPTGLSPRAANILIDGWLADGRMRQLPGDVLKELMSIRFISFSEGVRGFLFRANRIASEAIWNDDLLGAQKALRELGIPGNDQSPLSWMKLDVRYGKGTCSWLVSSRLSGKVNSVRHDWHYVKPTRSANRKGK